MRIRIRMWMRMRMTMRMGMLLLVCLTLDLTKRSVSAALVLCFVDLVFLSVLGVFRPCFYRRPRRVRDFEMTFARD